MPSVGIASSVAGSNSESSIAALILSSMWCARVYASRPAPVMAKRSTPMYAKTAVSERWAKALSVTEADSRALSESEWMW